MAPLVSQWTGREIRALRLARRMSVRVFADHLGVSDRMVSKWEVGGEAIQPRSVNQTALDRSLSMADPQVRARFADLVGEGRAVHMDAVALASGARLAVRHPVDDRLMVLIEPGSYDPPGGGAPVWLPGFCIDVHLVTGAEFEQFAQVTGHATPDGWRGGDTVAIVPWVDAQAYCAWASKALPTPAQLLRGAMGDEGMLSSGDLAEWCRDERTGLVRRVEVAGSPPGRLAAFRTVAPTAQLLALVAV